MKTVATTLQKIKVMVNLAVLGVAIVREVRARQRRRLMKSRG